MSSTSEEWLHLNFDLTSRLLAFVGTNVLDPNYRPNWRTYYLFGVVWGGICEVLYMQWEQRKNLLAFLEIFPNFMMAIQAVHTWLWCYRRPDEFSALRSKMVEILELLNETESNGPVIAKAMRWSPRLQKFIFTIHTVFSLTILMLPFFLWMTFDIKILIFVLYVPYVDADTDGGFLANLFLHILVMVAAYNSYTAQECLLLSVVMPVAAFVDAFGNEAQELNLMLKQEELDETAIHQQMNRIVKLHQLVNEYEAMLEELYNFLILGKIAIIYLGIVTSIVVVLSEVQNHMSIILSILQFLQLTQFCMVGTIVFVKNEQLLVHIYNIDWYELPKGQVKDLPLMLHQGQNPTSMTIGHFKILNVESYMDIVKSIYSYVMVLVTFI